jgi:sugar phosphate isomerase/epimerase
VRPVCLDHLSLVDLTPLELVEMAASAGFGAVSLFVTPLPLNPAIPDLSIETRARAQLLTALRDTGLAVGIVEPFMLGENPDWAQLERSAALAAELGGAVNALGFDKERARLGESVVRLAEIVRAAGAAMTIEAYPLSAIRSQDDALAMAMAAGRDVGLCVDTLHVVRAGQSWADIARLPRERIRHVQLNDGPLAAPADRINDAVTDRLPPGEGEFGLAALMPCIPDTAMVAVEAPFRAPRDWTPTDRARALFAATRRLMA